MGTPDLDTLKSTLVSNNAHAGWCTVAVFLGLLVEYTILLWPKWNELKRWEKVFTVLAGITIAGGVYGEYFFGSRAADAALQIENISEKQVAALKADAAAFNARAAGLIKEAEDERLARVKIEEKLAPRHLSIEQQNTIIAKLKPFAGTRINLFAFSSGGSDIIPFGNELGRILTGPNSANWIVSASVAEEFGLVVPGLGVEIQQNADPKSVEAAKALFKALADERLSIGFVPPLPGGATRAKSGSLNEDPRATIRIIIGQKP